MDAMRYLNADGVRPPSAMDRRVSRLIPSLLSKTLSELEPSADVLDIPKYGSR